MSVCGCGHHEDPVPRPRGYFRIEADTTTKEAETPWGMKLCVSREAELQIPNDTARASGSKFVNINYPRLNATVYCTMANTVEREIRGMLENRMERVALNVRRGERPCVVQLEDTLKGITCNVFISPTDNVVPMQFISTDSVSFIFTGAVYFHGNINADSIAPSVEIVEADVLNMLQNLEPYGNSSR